MGTDMSDAGKGLVERVIPFALFGVAGLTLYLALLAIVMIVLVLAVLIGYIVRIAVIAVLAATRVATWILRAITPPSSGVACWCESRLARAWRVSLMCWAGSARPRAEPTEATPCSPASAITWGLDGRSGSCRTS
ncbi:hypothetical protein ACGFYU_29775 [Streptomyces sp. NPDC048337]|uniref:hypothetical protein n=1 Tax=Streptomyces sp. NPDC048337 TaxID=3365535 RepID=UPI00371E3C7F